MNFWPGTKIRKSHGNAFDWKTRDPSYVLQDKDIKAVNLINKQKAELESKRSFTIYSKARREK